FVLIDSRHEPQIIDLEFMEWLGENEIPFSIVFTKSDKLGKTKLIDNLNKYKANLLERWEELPPIFITSSEKREGRDEILKYIKEIIKSITIETKNGKKGK
ncbi:MAG: YihA family ribosome biogenesis GTP-binding protein, partial [Bacteroidales bacterium]